VYTRPDGTGHGPSTGSSFECTLRQEIGLGDAATIRSVEIRWTDSGTVQRLSRLEPDRAYEVRGDAPAAKVLNLTRLTKPMPRERPGHVHAP
jgi:hypothetical protein